jgi:hypothetical protein
MGKYRDRANGLRRLRRPLTIALAFFGFFVLSNYFMGFTSSNLIEVKPPVIVPEDESLEFQSVGEQTGDGGDKDPRIPPILDPVTQNGNFGTLPGEDKEEVYDPSKDKTTCRHKRSRDYEQDPIVISGRFSGRSECDVPCTGDGSPDAVVGNKQQQCPHIKSIFFTMENSIPAKGSYDIVANTQLTSDVPLPYFSWAEYDFMRPVQKKTASAHIAAFISNCGPQRRLQWMETMMKHGINIHSYGNCMRNREVPQEYLSKYGSNYNALKIALVSTYKFTMSFENSATDDYVTEKLFGVLVSGSVPLYDGASNGKAFGPSSHSMIFANDYGTPEKLAKYLLYLDSNDTAYEEYLSWKKTGPTDDWVALVDLANVHSNCRLCIRTADLHRKEVGPVIKGQPKGETRPNTRALELHVRERGKFWLRNIYLTKPSVAQLKQKINEWVPHAKDSYLHSMYELWTRSPIKTDADVAKLTSKSEIEAVFVVPQKWEDKNLMW